MSNSDFKRDNPESTNELICKPVHGRLNGTSHVGAVKDGCHVQNTIINICSQIFYTINIEEGGLFKLQNKRNFSNMNRIMSSKMVVAN